jgi:1,4-dihydroxy-2-naphthoate octaprenyltransferase
VLIRSRRTLLAFLVHLRLPFQLMLAPFVLFGAYASGAHPEPGWLVPFLAIHVGLYGGATAYNSFYDRDRGPIGFLKRPVPPPGEVRDLALLVQAAAVLVLAASSLTAGAIALVMMGMGIAYSHPRPRWKASTAGGLAATAIGQGAGAVYLGFFAVGGRVPDLTLHVVALGASLVALGLYPITQVYQIDEDRARGDITFAVRYGWRAAFRFAVGTSGAGLWMLVAGLRPSLPAWAVAGVALAPLALAGVLAAWATCFDGQDEGRNHDWAMGIGVGASSLFWVVLAAGFARR